MTLKDRNGEVIKGAAGIRGKACWSAPQSQKGCVAYISTLHARIGQIGQYEASCQSCIDLPLNQRSQGCQFHINMPRIYRKGNPAKSIDVNDSARQNAIEHRGHTADGATPLTPFEMIQLRDFWLSSRKIEDFQMWVLFLLCVKAFLRGSEATGDEPIPGDTTGSAATGLHLPDSIDYSLCGIDNLLNVTSIALKVLGKADKQVTTLTLWPDQVNTRFCPIRHLLIYIYYMKIKGNVN